MKPNPTSLLQLLHTLGEGVVWCKSNNAAGQKVKKAANLGTTNNVSGTSLTDYLVGYQYNNDVLQFFPHAQGYVKHTVNPSNGASEFDYVYQYKDHLGNIRINYTFDTATNTLKILEENNYYPFGLKHQESLQPRTILYIKNLETTTFTKGIGFAEPIDIPTFMVNQTVPNSGYQYKYNGKEWQDALNHNVYSFGWRDYDPAIGRFQKLDRFSEKYYHMTPYQYGGNNPIIFNDIKGDSILIYSKKDNFNVKYENGNLYSQNAKTNKWEAYNGKNIKVEKNGNKSITGFLGKAVTALDRIRKGGVKGSQLISDLQNSAKYIRLNEGKNQAGGSSGTVTWDPSSTNGGPNQNGNNTREPFIGLTHELAHAHDGLRGPLNQTSIGMIGTTSIPYAEFYAMDWENQVRSENNIALRTHYGDDANGNVIGQNFQKFSFSTVQLQANFSNTGDLKIVPVSTTTTTVIPITKF